MRQATPLTIFDHQGFEFDKSRVLQYISLTKGLLVVLLRELTLTKWHFTPEIDHMNLEKKSPKSGNQSLDSGNKSSPESRNGPP